MAAKRIRKIKHTRLFITIMGSFLIVVGFLFWSGDFSRHPKYTIPVYGKAGQVINSAVNSAKSANHLKTPESVKAIYMTSCVVSTPSFRDKLVKLIEETEINSIVIDIKDFTGTLSYKPKNEDLLHAWESARCGTLDMEEFIDMLHKKNIYVIGRVTVFQDPHLSERRPDLAIKFASTGEIWRDRKGLNFIDVGAKDAWDYHVAIARDAYAIGFDEINFDYIRFPSDGAVNDMFAPHSVGKSKPEALESFFAYLHKELKPTGMVISADLFGMTTTNTDDLNIGQVLERALPYFDYIAPMVYPSHYPPQFNGWSDPNSVPYELIKYVMSKGVERTVATSTIVAFAGAEPIASTTPQLFKKPSFDKNKLRPWLQDFDYPVSYDASDVRAQIKATYDVGLNSWMLWDPGNIYTKEALESVGN